MGMGAAPASAWVIEDKVLRGLIPAEYEALETLLNKHELTFNDLARDVGMNGQVTDCHEDEAIRQAIGNALDNVYSAFRAQTSVGDSVLDLELNYYDSEVGDRYDEVDDGAMWIVDGMEQLTPAGKAMGIMVEHKQWTQFG